MRLIELKKISAAEIPKYTNIDLLNLNLTISNIITLRKSGYGSAKLGAENVIKKKSISQSLFVHISLILKYDEYLSYHYTQTIITKRN